MPNWSMLKNAIGHIVKENNNQEITGKNLNSVLNAIINSVGENATFVGVATINTQPGILDGPVFYLASTPGTYPNFSGLTADNAKLTIFIRRGSKWEKEEILLTSEKMPSPIIEEMVNIEILTTADRDGSGIRYGFKEDMRENYRIIFPAYSRYLICSEDGAHINPNLKLLFLRSMVNRVSRISTSGLTQESTYIKKNIRGHHWVPLQKVKGHSWKDMESDFYNRAIILDFKSDDSFVEKYGLLSLDFNEAFRNLIPLLKSNKFFRVDRRVEQPLGYTITELVIRNKRRTHKSCKLYTAIIKSNRDPTKVISDHIDLGVALYDVEKFKIVSNVCPFKLQVKVNAPYDILDGEEVVRIMPNHRAIAHVSVSNGQ